MLFAVVMIFIMFTFHRLLKGIWKSTIVIWSILFGSLAYYLILHSRQGEFSYEGPWFDTFFHSLNINLSFHPGVMISFLFCYIALLINDLGSIQSVNEILEVKDREPRIKKGVIITGLANLLAGFMGVIGPVNYSLSPGLILSTGCASRFTLIPAAAIMFILAFLPHVTGAAGYILPVVIGTVLAYLMASQIASGLMGAFKDGEGKGFGMENGMVIGISIFLGTIVTFLPAAVTENISPVLRPVLANGFVAGVTSAVLLERIFLKKGAKDGHQGK